MGRQNHPRYYYGWNIVGIGFLSTVVSGIGVYSLAMFVSPMTAVFNWTRTIFSVVQTIQTIGGGLAAPFIGPLLDKRGPRALMVIGGFLAGLSLILTSTVQSPWQFYLLRGGLFAGGMVAVGGFVASTTISKFFIRMRGRAIALSALGLSVAGIIVPPAAATMIEIVGWRETWIILGLAIWILIILPAALIMRRSPEDLGLQPDGDTEPTTDDHNESTRNNRNEAWASEGMVWTRSSLLRNQSFWFIIVAFALSTLAMQGIFLHMIPFVEEQGHTRIAAAGVFTVQNSAAFITKPIWGIAAERVRIRYAAALEFFLGAIGLSGVLIFTESLPKTYLFAIVIGTSIGGVVVNHQLVWANYFGRQSLGLVRGIAQPFTVLASALGPLAGGLLYDSNGSYDIVMPLFVFSYFLATIVILLAIHPSFNVDQP